MAWEKLAGLQGLPLAHFVAAAGILIAIPLTWRWKLQTGATLDLTPALHWRAPPVTLRVENNQGPVLVTVQYRVDAKNRAEFVAALDELRHRQRVTNADRMQEEQIRPLLKKPPEVTYMIATPRTHRSWRAQGKRRPQARRRSLSNLVFGRQSRSAARPVALPGALSRPAPTAGLFRWPTMIDRPPLSERAS